MRRMGGLAKKIPMHLRDDAHRLARDRRASRRWPASSARTRSSARRSRTASSGSGRSAASSPRHDRVLHVPADGPDVLGREPRSTRGRAGRSTSRRRSMTIAAHRCWRSRRSSLGIVPGPAARGRACISRAGWSRCSPRARRRSTLGPRRPFELFGIDGALIMASVAVAAIGVVVAWRPVRRRARADPRCRRRPSASAARPRARPVPLPRLAQQVVVRRPQPPAVHGHRRPDRGGPVVVRPARSSTARSTPSARSTVGAGARPPPDPDRPGPELRAGHRDRADRHGRLVPRRWRAADDATIATHPDPDARHVPAARRRARRRDRAGAYAAARWPSLPRSSTWVAVAAPAGRLHPPAPRQASSSSRRVDVDPGLRRSSTRLGVDGLSVVLVVLTTTLTWITHPRVASARSRTRIKEYMISFLDPRGRDDRRVRRPRHCSSSTSSGRSSSSRCT